MKKIANGFGRVFNSQFLNPKYACFDIAALILVAMNIKFH
jgi:hypothetical protein